MTAPRQIVFDPTPEIFAADSQGAFNLLLTADGNDTFETGAYDEMRFLVSIRHPSERHSIDLDRAYVELRGCFEPSREHWMKLAEIEPVVPPYGADSFDGWIVLPIFATQSALQVKGSGFDPRSRLQVRASAYFVA
jgi:hypothetical protein